MARSTHTASGRPRVSRNIELLLAEDVESLGKRGEIVRVKPGYARNYLIPNGLATMATEANKRAVVRHTEKLAQLFEQKMKDRSMGRVEVHHVSCCASFVRRAG